MQGQVLHSVSLALTQAGGDFSLPFGSMMVFHLSTGSNLLDKYLSATSNATKSMSRARTRNSRNLAGGFMRSCLQGNTARTGPGTSREDWAPADGIGRAHGPMIGLVFHRHLFGVEPPRYFCAVIA